MPKKMRVKRGINSLIEGVTACGAALDIHYIVVVYTIQSLFIRNT